MSDALLPDDDYILTDGTAWFTVKGFAVRVWSTDDGITVDIYPNGAEMDAPLASAHAFDDDLTEGAADD